MRTLAHFRPIEDNEKNKNPSATEPLNSRTNKLLCECWGVTGIILASVQEYLTYLFLSIQLLSVCMTWTEMTRSPEMSSCR